MKKKFSFLAFFALIALVWSCDDEYNDLGVNGIIGEGHYDFEHYSLESDYLKAFTKPTGAVQTNNLPINALGVYTDSYFGTTKASFVSQVELTTADPTIGYNVEVDSVYLYVPYFYDTDEVTTLDSGERTFVLESVYGNADQKFNLQVYENNYFLNDFDPANEFEAQQYYNNQVSQIEGVAGTTLLNNSMNTSQNTQFFTNDDERYIYKTDGNGVYVDASGNELSSQLDPTVRVIKERFTPGVWLDLNTTFFQDKLNEWRNNGTLVNNNVFKNSFKGLYFKVSEISAGQGSLAMLDFNQAQLKIVFKSTDESDGGEDDLERRVISMRMGYNTITSKTCNSINLLEYSSSSYNTAIGAISSNNETTGDDMLYLKGGQGSVVYIDLFDDAKLAELRAKDWLINEARLTFYVNQDKMANSKEPIRIYLYDATNETVLLDYTYDTSTATDSHYNKVIYNGILEKDSDSKGVKYQFRITNYIKYLLNSTTATNVRLGLCITESIGYSQNSYLETPILGMEYVPTANVMNPLGTVLYGSTYSDTTKRPKFEIFYTEQN